MDFIVGSKVEGDAGPDQGAGTAPHASLGRTCELESHPLRHRLRFLVESFAECSSDPQLVLTESLKHARYARSRSGSHGRFRRLRSTGRFRPSKVACDSSANAA